jgi:hypothetical protein
MKIDIVVRLDHFHRDAVWKGNDLIFHGRVVASVVLDAKWPRLVRLPDGHTTDMVNLSRARDAARSLALKALAPGLVGASPMRLNRAAVQLQAYWFGAAELLGGRRRDRIPRG